MYDAASSHRQESLNASNDFRKKKVAVWGSYTVVSRGYQLGHPGTLTSFWTFILKVASTST